MSLQKRVNTAMSLMITGMLYQKECAQILNKQRCAITTEGSKILKSVIVDRPEYSIQELVDPTPGYLNYFTQGELREAPLLSSSVMFIHQLFFLLIFQSLSFYRITVFTFECGLGRLKDFCSHFIDNVRLLSHQLLCQKHSLKTQNNFIRQSPKLHWH